MDEPVDSPLEDPDVVAAARVLAALLSDDKAAVAEVSCWLSDEPCAPDAVAASLLSAAICEDALAWAELTLASAAAMMLLSLPCE